MLIDIRATVRQPGYRQRLLGALSSPVELGTLRVLRTVERAESPSVGDIAESLAIDPSSASRMVDRCVVNGLLDRRASEQDRRRTELALTAAGLQLLESANTRRRRMLAEATSGWTRGDLDRLTSLLNRLRAGFDALEESAP